MATVATETCTIVASVRIFHADERLWLADSFAVAVLTVSFGEFLLVGTTLGLGPTRKAERLKRQTSKRDGNENGIDNTLLQTGQTETTCEVQVLRLLEWSPILT